MCLNILINRQCTEQIFKSLHTLHTLQIEYCRDQPFILSNHSRGKERGICKPGSTEMEWGSRWSQPLYIGVGEFTGVEASHTTHPGWGRLLRLLCDLVTMVPPLSFTLKFCRRKGKVGKGRQGK